jgi:hypothetical protein
MAVGVSRAEKLAPIESGMCRSALAVILTNIL